MNKKIKIIIVADILLLNFIYILFFSIVYARDPNSSKGYAEYNEEAAQIETETLLEQQIKEDEIKSDNNYIKQLEIEGYEIYPKFNKDITDYNLKLNDAVNEINIIATAEEPLAYIEGIGKIKINENQILHKIYVTSESGVVRTYTINIDKTEDIEKNTEVIGNNFVDANSDNSKNNIVILILLLILGIILVWILKKHTCRKGKHSGKN